MGGWPGVARWGAGVRTRVPLGPQRNAWGVHLRPGPHGVRLHGALGPGGSDSEEEEARQLTRLGMGTDKARDGDRQG